AHAGTDYTATSGSITFNPGDTSKIVSVPLMVGPRTVTGTESFSLALSGGGGVVVGPAASSTIAAPPPLPTLTISNASASDNAAGSVTLTVTRTGDLTLPSTVHFSTADGNAKSGVEYTANSGTISFAAGQATATVSVNILAESK